MKTYFFPDSQKYSKIANKVVVGTLALLLNSTTVAADDGRIIGGVTGGVIGGILFCCAAVYCCKAVLRLAHGDEAGAANAALLGASAGVGSRIV